MPSVSAVMPKPEKKPEYAVYRALKVDEDIIPLVRKAVSDFNYARQREGLPTVTLQEWVSDTLNRAASSLTGEPPVNRRPAPPKPKGKGRPPTKKRKPSP